MACSGGIGCFYADEQVAEMTVADSTDVRLPPSVEGISCFSSCASMGKEKGEYDLGLPLRGKQDVCAAHTHANTHAHINAVES